MGIALQRFLFFEKDKYRFYKLRKRDRERGGDLWSFSSLTVKIIMCYFYHRIQKLNKLLTLN